MKPLLTAVVAICLLIPINALPENEEVKDLSQSKEPVVEAEDSEPQARKERCTTCTGGFNYNFGSPNQVLAEIQAAPGAEVHTQQSFEGCSSDKGCAGIKVKDGRVIERFGNVDAFRQAAASDAGSEFTFHAAGALGNVLEGGIPNEGPYWWMNQNSPFKAGAGAGAVGASGSGGSFEKFSKSSSSFSTTGNAAGVGGLGGAGVGGLGGANAAGTGQGAAFGASLDLSGNPFLNGEFSKIAGGFAGGQEVKPASFQSSSFESSSFTSKGEVDLTKNQFGNGGANKFGASGFQGQGGFAAGGGQGAFGAGQSGFAAGSQSGQSAFGAGAGQSGQSGFGAGSGQNGYSGSNSQSGFSASSNSQSGYSGSAGSNQNGFGAGSNGLAGSSGQNGFAAGGQGFQNQGFASGSKFSSSGYTGSSPSPFTASTAGSNVNLIQNQQKTSEFDFEQQQQNQQNIDEVFQGTGNVHAHEHSGGELQQTCAGQGYVCVHKAQCNNGVVNTNGAGILQAKTKKQYCNIKTEICCRIEISTLSGAGGLQGSLGVGAATYSGQGAQGSQGGLFVSSNQGSSQSSNSAQGFGQAGQAGQAGQGSQAGQAGSFGSSTGSSSFESSSFGSSSRGQGTQGSQGRQGAQGAQGTQGAQGSAFGAQGQFGSNSGFGTNGFGTAGSANRGVTIESSSSSFESSSRGGSAFGAGNSGNGLAGNGGLAGNSGTAGSTNKFGAAGTFSNTNFGATGTNGVPAVPGANRFGSTTGNEVVYKQTSQSNFIETDSFTAGSEGAGIYRPGAAGLKPGIPYLPPVDATNSGSNVVGSTAFSTTARPFTPPRPTYLPPVTSTSAPGYLPPEVPEQTINTETRVPNPNYNEGSLILDETIQPRPKPPPAVGPSEIPSGCAAALKCTPIEFCTAEGVISNTTVILNRDQEAFRVPLTDCKDVASGTIGKCCRDPYYTDPWPTNQLGKWVPGVFGGNDGKYAPDSRGSGSIARPQVTVRPPVTGSTFLNNFRTPKPTIPPFGPNQVTPGFPATTSQSAFGQKSQFEVRGQGQFGQGGQGQFAQGGQGQFGTAGQGQASQGGQFSQGSSQFTSSSQSFGQQGQSQLGATQGQGQLGGAQLGVAQGQGQFTQQGQGQFAQGGRGQFGVGGLGQLEVQGQGAQGQFTQTSQSSSQSTTTRGQGQAVLAGQGQSVSQGFGSGIRQGQGFAVSQGAGFGVENEYSESSQRVFLQQYSAGGQCGLFNGQKPYGNRNELEVDFAEIPWQAMVLLQTNKSLLCGGVITRPDVVITSASCVDGLEAKNVLIKGGEWKLGIDDEPLPFQIVQVKNILRHPFYKRGSYINDVAILVLGENLRFAKNIYPICLPRAGETLDAYYNGAGECIVTGWGKQVLQAHLSGAIMHSLNISLINPGECQAKLSQDYPHLLEQYDQDTCACGQPTNPVNNICRVDIGSALACTTGDNHFVLRGIYSWDSGCQLGNQLAAFYKFDLEWYEWAIGLIESARFAQFSSGSAILSQNRFASQINSGVKGASGIKGGASGFGSASGIKGGASGFGGASSITGGASGFGSASGIKSGASGFSSASSIKGGSSGFGSASGIKGGASGFKGFGQIGFGGSQGQFASGGGQGQFASGGSQGQFSSGGSQFSSGQYSQYNQASKGSSFGELKGPVTNSFSSSFSEKKVFQSEPKIITYTTKPEIVTFTTKPELFTFTTKPKIVTYTTKPQIIRYETSGSGQNPQYVAPGVTFNPSFSDLVGKQHTHNAQCKCLDGQGKKK